MFSDRLRIGQHLSLGFATLQVSLVALTALAWNTLRVTNDTPPLITEPHKALEQGPATSMESLTSPVRNGADAASKAARLGESVPTLLPKSVAVSCAMRPVEVPRSSDSQVLRKVNLQQQAPLSRPMSCVASMIEEVDWGGF